MTPKGDSNTNLESEIFYKMTSQVFLDDCSTYTVGIFNVLFLIINRIKTKRKKGKKSSYILLAYLCKILHTHV